VCRQWRLSASLAILAGPARDEVWTPALAEAFPRLSDISVAAASLRACVESLGPRVAKITSLRLHATVHTELELFGTECSALLPQFVRWWIGSSTVTEVLIDSVFCLSVSRISSSTLVCPFLRSPPSVTSR
jgi:hypothetical protein